MNSILVVKAAVDTTPVLAYTGVSVLPAWMLIAIGGLSVVAGILYLVRKRLLVQRKRETYL